MRYGTKIQCNAPKNKSMWYGNRKWGQIIKYNKQFREGQNDILPRILARVEVCCLPGFKTSQNL